MVVEKNSSREGKQYYLDNTLQGIFYEYFENKCKTWTQLIQGIADECAGGKPWFDFFFFSLKRSVPLIESVMNWHLIA